MTRRLVLLIDESWPAHPSAAWVLLDARDHIVEQGQSEPRHWPAATDCEVVLGGAQCAWIEARLPKCPRREEPALLRYALEDQLIRDVEEQHLTITDREPLDNGTLCAVLVTGRARLRAVLAQLETIGRRPSRVVSELQMAPPPAHGWAINVRAADMWIVRTGPRKALPTDAAAGTDVVRHLLQLEHPTHGGPATLEIRQAPGAAPTEADGLGDVTGLAGLELSDGPPYRWWAASHACDDLLHGEFAAVHARSGLLRGLRAPAAVALVAMLALLLANLGEVLWQQHRLDAAEARMVRLFETSVANTPAIAPVLQMQRALDDARSRHGQLRQDDFLTLLDTYSATAGTAARGAVVALEYENGALGVQVEPGGAAALPLVAARLRALGHDAEAATDRSPGITLNGRASR